jgi:hypothetical protein
VAQRWQVGADGAVFLRVFKMGFELFAASSYVAIMLLVVFATGENKKDGVVGLSLANVEDGSPRLWGVVGGMWFVSMIVYYVLRVNYNEILAITQEFKVGKLPSFFPFPFMALCPGGIVFIDHHHKHHYHYHYPTNAHMHTHMFMSHTSHAHARTFTSHTSYTLR